MAATSEPSHKYDKTSKFRHLGAQSSGTMTQNWWRHKRCDHTQAGIRHNHQRGCGSRTFSPLWRRFWLCRLFPVQGIQRILQCVTAHWHPHRGCYCWHLRHSSVCAITSYCGCVRVPAPAKSHLIAASSRVAAQNSRQNEQSSLLIIRTTTRRIQPKY